MAGFARGSNIYVIHPDMLEELTIHKKESNEPRIKHELSHVFYWSITNTHRPNWLDEGLACYLDGHKSIKKLTNHEKLGAPLYFSRFDEDIYNVSVFTVKALIEKFGKEKMLELLRTMRLVSSEREFYKLFKDTYGFRFTKAGIAKNLL